MTDFDKRLADYLDGELDDDAADLLARELEQDPEALARLTELSNLDRMLETRMAPVDGAAFSSSVMASIKQPRRSRLRWLGLAGAGLAAAALIWLLRTPVATPPTPGENSAAIVAMDVRLDGRFEAATSLTGTWAAIDRAPRPGELLRLASETGSIVYPDGSRVSLSQHGIVSLIRNHGPRFRLYIGRAQLSNRGDNHGQIALAAGTVDVPAGRAIAVTLEVIAGTASAPKALRITLAGRPGAAQVSFIQKVAVPLFILQTEMVVPAAIAPAPRPAPPIRSRTLLHLTHCGMWEVDRTQTSLISG